MNGTKLSKTQLRDKLLGYVEQWVNEGCTPEEAIGKLTDRQYDFLIDMGIDFDNYLLTPEQQKVVQQIKKAPRRCSPEGYNKKYPQSKQDLYNGIVKYIESQGATVIPRPKQNFRDLDFKIGDTTYKIVLSNPRPEKD